jgi:Family of unknown function (DUF5677)
MSVPVIAPPTKAVTSACDALDEVIARFLDSRASVRGYEKYSSSAEALLLFNLVIRQVEGVLVAARHDLVLLPAALACARAALETAAKAAWMLDTNDPFVRETRWLAHVEEEARVYDRSSKRYSEVGQDASYFAGRAIQIRAFRKAVEAKLPPGVAQLKHIPTVDEMLTSLQGKQLYPLYIYLSQFVHGGHAATELHRRGVGTELQAGEYIEPSHWYIPLRVCWLSLKEPASLALWRLGRREKTYLTQALASKATAAIELVKATEH